MICMFFMGYYWVKKQGSIRNYFFIEIRFDTNYDSNWEYVPSHIVALKRCILNLDSSDLTSKHTYGSFKLDSQNLIEF